MSTSKICKIQIGMLVQDLMFETLSLEEGGWGNVLATREQNGGKWIKIYWLDKYRKSPGRRCEWRRAEYYSPVAPPHRLGGQSENKF